MTASTRPPPEIRKLTRRLRRLERRFLQLKQLKGIPDGDGMRILDLFSRIIDRHSRGN